MWREVRVSFCKIAIVCFLSVRYRSDNLWQIYKRYPLLSPHLQIRPCLVHPYLPQPHCWAIKKGSLWNNLAWWPLPAPSIPMPPPSPTTSHHHAPLLLALCQIFLPPFLYTRGHYQNYNLQIYKATNTNRCNINGVCLVVLAKEDISYPYMHAGMWALAWCAWKRRIHISLHGKQGKN